MKKLTQKILKEIKNNPDIVDWMNISNNYNLTEKFIEKHWDRFNWRNISMRQNLSKKFISKWISKIDFVCLSINSRVSLEIKMCFVYYYDYTQYVFIKLDEKICKLLKKKYPCKKGEKRILTLGEVEPYLIMYKLNNYV